jgi:hypothetical protein
MSVRKPPLVPAETAVSSMVLRPDRRRQVQSTRLVATVSEVDVAASTVVISDVWDKQRRHAQLDVVATANTAITVDGQPATLAEIHPHDQVVVAGVVTGTLVLAWEIYTVGPLYMTG